jgi:RecA-family ATPase
MNDILTDVDPVPLEIYERGFGGSIVQPKREVRIVRGSELTGPAPSREWLCEPLVPAFTVTLLAGDGGTGKSLLAMQLSVAVASPQAAKWCGLSVASGAVLYLSAEDDVDEIHRRLASICEASGLNVEDLDRLSIIALAGEDAVLAAPDKAGLKTTPLFAAIEQQIEAERPVLVVADTLADIFAGQENERAQARQFVGLLRGWAIRYDTTILLLSHPSLSGLASGTGMSGSTAWGNSVRSRLYFDRVKVEDIEPDPDARVLRTKKSNYARTGGEIRLRWQDGVFVVTDNAAAASAFGAIAERSRAEQVFLRLIDAFAAEGRHVSATPSANYAPAVFAKDSRADGINRRGFQDAMSRLFASREIVVSEFGPASRRLRKIVRTIDRESGL